jgi:hypothetical protein
VPRREFDDALLDPESPERRATLKSILALLSGVTITIAGCGSDESPTMPSPGTGGVSGSITANHGHAATITSAQLMANNTVTLQIRGSATHPHTVELSAQELSQIGAAQRISKTSSTDTSPDAGVHSHVVTFN